MGQTAHERDLAQAIKEQFGLRTEVQSVILDRADVSRTATATVFLAANKQLIAYIEATSPLTLGDVQKIMSRMGLRVESYLPPKGWPQYFRDIASEKFKQVFPGRTPLGEDDLMFYKTLVPYNPALALISEVKNGEIYQFDADAHDGWRVGARLYYRRILTS